MKTLILGLGNPILSDDGVGIRVAEELKDRLNQPEVTVMEVSVAGLDFLDLLAGYDRAFIIDAIQTREGKAGQIYRLEPEAFDATRHTTTPHNVSFTTALELGNRLGLALPQQIVIFAIEVEDVSSFSEECTPEVMAAIPTCVRMVIQELSKAPRYFAGGTYPRHTVNESETPSQGCLNGN